ncbi:hypothetical protein FOQG_05350 [Fusarium oxysporum f. sp. raphani 54005]|uniref:Uncharacterized protein n=8 Tax=Fusarium oxysporum TaxID=5507 RepID=W9HV46_FUSOX|nr:hypothetical protein FOXG_20785 [Fusarium oxysporum f. sp. lycopersici 4287]EWY86222.1 hypothetical protein FOYG_10828 [Fusarium oxysporum NRRL 32931]EWZ31850.1 hypothetical protein FOZG_14903 [Fusarium oxysporum Fo47]EWZ94439.1 hypothetical protein FOWG_04728 [Fusarium oxysporum f. sp. lycopersici MN25]EXA39436.1 hypothetical protein FOVG_10992 [Fusarium oxysporum f. sp. pisi HDV247]EXK38122.1 hypothetical protein FOMG_08598 [Fusarium oxysporum f. sp. melonis 26406]EXK93165.1 hypothetical
MKNRSGRGLRQKVLVLGFWSGRAQTLQRAGLAM